MSRRHSLPQTQNRATIDRGAAELQAAVARGASLFEVLSLVVRLCDGFAAGLQPLERTAISRVLGMVEAAADAAIKARRPADLADDELLTVAETAAALRLSRSTVRLWANSGQLPGAIRYRKGGPILLRRRVIFQEWLTKQGVISDDC